MNPGVIAGNISRDISSRVLDLKRRDVDFPVPLRSREKIEGITLETSVIACCLNKLIILKIIVYKHQALKKDLKLQVMLDQARQICSKLKYFQRDLSFNEVLLIAKSRMECTRNRDWGLKVRSQPGSANGSYEILLINGVNITLTQEQKNINANRDCVTKDVFRCLTTDLVNILTTTNLN